MSASSSFPTTVDLLGRPPAVHWTSVSDEFSACPVHQIIVTKTWADACVLGEQQPVQQDLTGKRKPDLATPQSSAARKTRTEPISR